MSQNQQLNQQPNNHQDFNSDNSEQNPYLRTNIKNSSWPKQLYYYTILTGCILSLAFGSFGFLRANLIRFVFPEADYMSYPMSNPSQCTYKGSSIIKNLPPMMPTEPPVASQDSSGLNSPEEKRICELETKKEQEKELNRRYQQELISSILSIAVAGAVLVAHIYSFKKIKI